MKPGEIIKELRSKCNLTQNELAKKVGVEQSTIAMIELGKRNPSIELAQKIADIFGVTTDDILGREVKNEDLPADVRVLLRNVQESGLTKDQLKTINAIINQFKEANKK